MAARFTATMNAVNRGLESTKPNKGADLVEDWETEVADLDYPGAKGIARDLASLRKQLERDEPDADRILNLVHRLGAATSKIADRAEGASVEKLKQLGEALSEAGEEDVDEAEDTAASKAPKRKFTRKK